MLQPDIQRLYHTISIPTLTKQDGLRSRHRITKASVVAVRNKTQLLRAGDEMDYHRMYHGGVSDPRVDVATLISRQH